MAALKQKKRFFQKEFSHVNQLFQNVWRKNGDIWNWHENLHLTLSVCPVSFYNWIVIMQSPGNLFVAGGPSEQFLKQGEGSKWYFSKIDRNILFLLEISTQNGGGRAQPSHPPANEGSAMALWEQVNLHRYYSLFIVFRPEAEKYYVYERKPSNFGGTY